ncbi:unnamed protein product, partial [Scytosiphon promiscuus]
SERLGRSKLGRWASRGSDNTPGVLGAGAGCYRLCLLFRSRVVGAFLSLQRNLADGSFSPSEACSLQAVGKETDQLREALRPAIACSCHDSHKEDSARPSLKRNIATTDLWEASTTLASLRRKWNIFHRVRRCCCE